MLILSLAARRTSFGSDIVLFKCAIFATVGEGGPEAHFVQRRLRQDLGDAGLEAAQDQILNLRFVRPASGPASRVVGVPPLASVGERGRGANFVSRRLR